MIALLAALLAMQPDQSGSHATVVEHVDIGPPLQGSDYLLIRKAARHPEMENADLSCYDIFVYDSQGARRVAFVSRKERITERMTSKGLEITYHSPDPECRSLDFVMGRGGRVVRVIRSRH